MKKLIFCFLLSITSLTMLAQSTEFAQYVEVQGKAEQMVEPDQIEVRIMLNEATSKGRVTLREMESQLAQSLKEADVDASKQLVIVSQSNIAQRKTGVYQFKSYLLTLTSAQQVNAVFEALTANGIQNASIGKMYSTAQDQINKELQVEAMKESQKVAQNLAQSIGQSIGVALQIQYWNNSQAVNYGSENTFMRKASSDMLAVSLPDDLKIRPINIQVSVTVRYALLGK